MPVISATQEAKTRRTEVQDQSCKMLVRPHLNKYCGHVVHACDPSYIGGIEETQFEAGPWEKTQDPK
jgi:hypothetical protein